MTDKGLSIFDDEPGTDVDIQATQVIPVAKPKDEPPAAAKPAAKVPAPAAEPTRPIAQQPAPATAPPAAAATPAARPASAPQLPIVRRGGYDPSAVDAYLRQLHSDKAGLGTNLASAERRVAELEDQLRHLRTQVSEQESPSYAGLGGRASAMLRLAEEEAQEVRDLATKQADQIRADAEKEAKQIKAAAAQDAEDMRVVQLKDLEEQRSRLLAEAEQDRSIARSESEHLRSAAKREADQLRLASEQETTEQRTSAQREVEQARAAADREVAEARRTLAVERERLAREATDHHATAMSETKRLVEDAEARAQAAEACAASACV